MPPVDLGLLPRRGLVAHRRGGGRSLTMGRHEGAYLPLPAAIPLCPQLLEVLAGVTYPIGEALLQIRSIRIELRATRDLACPPPWCGERRGDRRPHRLAVTPGQPRDRADRDLCWPLTPSKA